MFAMIVHRAFIPLLLAAVFGLCSAQADTEDGATPLHVQQYRRLFKLRRAERLEAVKSILKLGNFEKQAKLVNVVLNKINEVSVLLSKTWLISVCSFCGCFSYHPAQRKHQQGIFSAPPQNFRLCYVLFLSFRC